MKKILLVTFLFVTAIAGFVLLNSQPRAADLPTAKETSQATPDVAPCHYPDDLDCTYRTPEQEAAKNIAHDIPQEELEN